MKNVALLVLLASTMVFAGLYLRQTNNLTHAQIAVERLEQQVGALQSTVEDTEKKTDSLRTGLKQAQAEAAARDSQIVQLKATSTNPALRATAAGSAAVATAAKPSNPLSMIAKMFDDPEMKQAMVAQQKAALGPMIDKMYGKLFSDLHLTPDQTASLKEMLLNKQSAGAEIGLSMLSGGAEADPTKTADLAKKVKAGSDAADAEIKAFLGDEKFAQLKAYEKTTADRMAISGFKDQLNAGAALTPEQEQQLIEAMSQTRDNFKFTTDLSDKTKLAGDFSAMFNEETVNRYIEEMDQLNQHYVGNAQNILTPDQLESFRKHLNNQQAMQKMGMQMGAKMFAPVKRTPAKE
ncbi:MAG TPA: hypothetical protein VM680_17385 [Verrucomicrobiae bacterium]|nr:hypothetical protein [Verrucomicrobiae bacterium]